jgi:hypothetical protein
MPVLRREAVLSINPNGWNKVAPLLNSMTALHTNGPLAATANDVKARKPIEFF